jgi:uncharacterized protein
MTATALRLEETLSATDVLAALEATERPTDAALRSGVICAGEITPAVIEVLDKAANGSELLEPEENLLFWGIHVLGAAYRTELYRPLMRLLRACAEDDLDRVLGDAITETLASIVISVFDGDPLPLLDACADRGVEKFARWKLLGALARLTFDGAVRRETTLAFLDRFEREALADPDDPAWLGWQDAICLLGLEEMRERLCTAYRRGRIAEVNGDLDYWLNQLTVARNLTVGDDALFIREQLVPIDDPVAALAWTSDDDAGGDEDWDDDFEVPDPASEFALSEEEIDEVRQFVASRPATVAIMPLEAIDGYYSALAMDPDLNRIRHAAAQIFGSPDRSLYFDSREQEERIARLLMRHLKTIATRLNASYAHVPILDESAEPRGRVWATGFIEGMQVAVAQWEVYIGSDDVTEFLSPFLVLSLNDGEERDGVRMTPEKRAKIIPLMSVNLLGLYAAVRRAEQERKRQPARSAKVGRNEPCPCGSGKKYKRCCGASDRQIS